MGSFASFWVVLLLVAGESVSSDDDDEEFTVTDGTFTQCLNHGDSSLSRWLSQRSDVRVSLWLLSYTGLERNVWCSEDQYAECRGGVSHSITLEGVSTPKKGKYKCVVRKSKTINYTQGFTLTALRGAASHSNPAPEGSSLSLTCEGWGLSEVQKWEWTRNSEAISGTRKYMNNASLNTLTIRSLEKKSDGGTYRCEPVFQQIELKHSVSIEYTVTIAGESVSSDDDDEEFTVTDGTFTQCPNEKIKNLSRWLSQRSDVNVSLWLLSYTGLDRNVWCSEDEDAECRGVPRSITLEGVSTPKKGKYNCRVRKNKKEKDKRGFTLIALRGAASHSNPAPEGSPLNLTCESWGLPEVQKWEWTNNSAVISGTSKYMNNANLNTLTIRSLEKKSDGGTYTCKPVFQQIELKHSVSIEYTVTIAGLTITSINTPEKTTTGLTIASTSTTEESTAGLTIASTSTTEESTADLSVVVLVAGAALVMAVVALAVVVCIIKKNRDQTQGTPDPAPQHAGASGDYENLPPGAPEQQGPDNTEPTYMGLNLAEQSVYSTLQSVEVSKPAN